MSALTANKPAAFPPLRPGASLLLSHKPQAGPSSSSSSGGAAASTARRRTVLIVGTERLAAARLSACAEAGAWPVVLSSPSSSSGRSEADDDSESESEESEIGRCAPEIQYRIQQGECTFLSWRRVARLLRRSASHAEPREQEQDAWAAVLEALDRLAAPSCCPSASLEQRRKLEEEYTQRAYQLVAQAASPAFPTEALPLADDPQIFAVCITDTLHSSSSSSPSSASTSTNNASLLLLEQARHLAALCRRRRIPITVADHPEMCDFSFPVTHRFSTTTTAAAPSAPPPPASSASCLQIAVTTNGKGCRLAGRIRREIVALLPRNVADAVENIGLMREMARSGDHSSSSRRRRVQQAAQLRERRRRESRAMEEAQEQGQEQSNAKGRKADNSRGKAAAEDDESFDPTPINSPVPQLSRHNSSRQLGAAAGAEGGGGKLLQNATLRLAAQHGGGGGGGGGADSAEGDRKHAEGTATPRAGDSAAPREEAIEVEEEEDEDEEEEEERTKRRMRWVAQMSEYWPIEYLGNLDQQKMQGLLDEYQAAAAAAAASSSSGPIVTAGASADAARVAAKHAAERRVDSARDGGTASSRCARQRSAAGDIREAESGAEEDDSLRGRIARAEDQAGSWSQPRTHSQHSLVLPPPSPTSRGKRGHIYIVGSGPGHPSLLTEFAHKLLLSPETHLVLSDKLVPAPILGLIPPTTPLVIARKFPGNAEGAQSELIALALEAAVNEGKNVVRLKQGDPFIYGRGGEELLAFRKAGVESTLVPGITSSIAGPGLLGMAVTQRGAADSMILCTGVGRGGKKVKLPGYERGRSLVLLMGVARIAAVIDILTKPAASSAAHSDFREPPDRDGAPFPSYLPIAVVERASSADQRVIASTLDGIVAAIEQVGEQRPPGMILIGWSVLALEGEGDTTVLDDQLDISQRCSAGEISVDAAEIELRERDHARIARWLAGRSYITREGLDKPYSDALRAARETAASYAQPAQLHLPESGASGQATLAPNGDSSARRAAAELTNEAVGDRSQSGWAKARYGAAAPEGGWMADEKENIPAKDMQTYLAHLSLPDQLAAAKQSSQ